jgi:hypothetical protein
MCRTRAVSREFLLKQWGRFRHWLGAQIARGHSWLAAPRVTRKGLHRGFLVGLAVVALMLWYNRDWFAALTWAASILPLLILLLLAAFCYYQLARIIFPKAFPPRIRIKPFLSLQDKECLQRSGGGAAAWAGDAAAGQIGGSSFLASGPGSEGALVQRHRCWYDDPAGFHLGKGRALDTGPCPHGRGNSLEQRTHNHT